MSSEPLLVGVDVGTTNVKAVVFEPDGRAVAEASMPTPTRHPRPAWAYYDPEELWQSTVLNRPITVIELAEATSLGAAVLGGMGAGVYADVPSAVRTLRCARTTVEPVADQVPLYEATFQQVYGQIYPSLRPLHQAIDRLQQGTT